MESLAAGVSAQAAVILGAGASRADLTSALRGVLPPLDADFFQQLQALKRMTRSVSRTLEVARELFGPEPAVTMEEFFTQIEFFTELARVGVPVETQDAIDREPGLRYRDARRHFMAALLDALREAGIAEESRSGFAPAPGVHQRLAAVLQPGDAIISFNYDTLVDYALRESHPNYWDLSLPVKGETEYWGLSNPSVRATRDGSKAIGYPPAIHVHKMHGCINWRLVGGEVHLTKPPFRAASMKLIPPAWNKRVRGHKAFSAVWTSARLALTWARALIIAGYSVPRTDMLAQALLQATAAVRVDRPFGEVMIANPDQSTTRGLVAVIGPAIGPSTRIRCFRDFADLAHFLNPF